MVLHQAGTVKPHCFRDRKKSLEILFYKVKIQVVKKIYWCNSAFFFSFSFSFSLSLLINNESYLKPQFLFFEDKKYCAPVHC